MARSILSLGIDSALAAMMAVRRRALCAGPGRPALAATVISRASLEKSLERSLSCLPLRNMIFLNWLWPAICHSWLVARPARPRRGLPLFLADAPAGLQ